MNESHLLRQQALRTVHTVRTVHRLPTAHACGRAVRLRQRPRPSTQRRPTVQLGRDVATRANVGVHTAHGAGLDRPNGSSVADQAGARGGHSRGATQSFFRAEGHLGDGPGCRQAQGVRR